MDLSFENGVQIPSELMVNILSRCGTNDLLAFKLVSKNWFFTIKNPNFVRIHTEFGHDRMNSSFLLGSRFVSAEEAYDRLITVSSNADGEELLNVLRLHPLMDQNIFMDLLGTYNGLIFVKVTNDDETVRLFICNPATKRVRLIQDFVLPMPTGRVKFDFGFNDLSSSMYILVIYEDSNNGNQLRVMLYSCLTHTWTNINPPDFHTNIWESKSVCINGIIYWVSYPPIEVVEQLPIILRFDFADRIFSTISGPSNRPVFSYVPVEFQGSLAIICGELQGTEIVRYITMQLIKNSPCMVKSRCSKHFPKKFTDMTSFDDDGYCKYRRRDSGIFIEKSGIKLDNRFVVPYNPTLLRYQAHINVEFCNQSRSIKYLFKYVSKGHDKVTAALCNSDCAESSEENCDEIKTYLDCVVFPDNAPIDAVVFNATVKQTKFLAWLEANKKYPKARFLTYSQFPTKFVYKIDSRQWFERKSGCSIGRLYYVAPGSDDDKEYIEGIIEGSKWCSGFYLRKLFAILLIHNTISRPAHVWENTWMYLSDDILLKERHRTANPDLHLDDDRVQEIALAEIENFLKINGRSLADFPPMPIPNEVVMRNIGNLLISEELNYDRNALRTEHAHLLSSLTNEQSSGKTYIWKTLTSAIRSKGEIVLAVASSGIASQLIPGGRTAHSRFAIPLNIDGNSTCHIVQGSDLAELMVHTKLIIWDETPKAHRHCFEALDRTLRDIMHSQNAALAKHPFGGKVVVLGSDFRQILPVIPRAGREDIVLASLNSSYLWSSCKVLSLTKNMKLSQGNSVEEISSISRFAEWILKVGEGNIGKIMNDEEHEITIDDAEDPIQAIVESTYPKLLDNYKNYVYFSERAILSPTLDDVAQVNEFMLGLLPGEERTYLSSDTICNQDPQDQLAEVYTTEFLNTICGSGLPYHQLKLKVCAPIMLLRNIDRSMGLCNGTRLILTRMCEHVIEASIMSEFETRRNTKMVPKLYSECNEKMLGWMKWFPC
ncbi:uncharacterized protein G2W53_001235 [Senna tora]|uniref:ATP-dependent DNA helicase n=1 Tax=Senna tora TaxID=362788 RepID=A0A834XF62_9FABA|nr:uncharacterized protein G2W53_001235 [Senna tora]